MFKTPSLILIAGQFGSGKTTIMQSFTRIFANTGLTVSTISFSNPIKQILNSVGFIKLPASSKLAVNIDVYRSYLQSRLQELNIIDVDSFIEQVSIAYKSVFSQYLPSGLILTWKFKHKLLQHLKEYNTLDSKLDEVLKTVTNATTIDIAEYLSIWRRLAQTIGSVLKQIHTETIFAEIFYSNIYNLIGTNRNMVLLSDDWRFPYEDLRILQKRLQEQANLFSQTKLLAEYYELLLERFQKLEELLTILRIKVIVEDNVRCRRLNISCNELRKLSQHESEQSFKQLAADIQIDNNHDKLKLYHQVQKVIRQLAVSS